MNLALARGRNVTTHTSSGEAFFKGENIIYMLYDNYTIIVTRGKSDTALLQIDFSSKIYRMFKCNYNLFYKLNIVPLVTPFDIHQPSLSVFRFTQQQLYKIWEYSQRHSWTFSCMVRFILGNVVNLHTYSQLIPIKQKHASLEMKTLPGHVSWNTLKA